MLEHLANLTDTNFLNVLINTSISDHNEGNSLLSYEHTERQGPLERIVTLENGGGGDVQASPLTCIVRH